MPMKKTKNAAALAAAGLAAAAHAQVSTDPNAELETVLITSQRAERISRGATGLDLDIHDTPQSISFVTSERMADFAATSINEALRLATGLNVEQWETNRTNYMARGFDIKNTQIDGVGLPNDWGIVTGAVDAFGYEKIEVIRGANGLLTGIGNSSGTINYVRKRPTNERQGFFALTSGRWDHLRVEADYSTPFTANGSWADRLVIASEKEDSWLRGLSNERSFVYGVVDGQLGERTTLAAGYSYQDADSDGNMWGGLFLTYIDGSQAEFDRSASTALDWTMWDTIYRNGFVELTHLLPADWNLKLTYNRRSYSDESKLFFAWTEDGLDPETGLGLFGWPGNWPTEDEADLVDLTANGEFELFGRRHQAIVGMNYSRGELTQYSRPADPDDPAWGALPPFPYPGDAFAEPQWGEKIVDSVLNQRMKRLYGATRLELTDRLAAVLGFNWIDYHRDGHQSGVPFALDERELSPYAGVTFRFTDRITGYASYSDIYQPQDYYDIDGFPLDPSKGENYEIGVKADWLENRLLTTLALFRARQLYLGTYGGMSDDGRYYYVGTDVDSEGVELEITGRINEYVDVVLGVTSLELEGQDGGRVYEWVPRQTVNFAVTGRLPGPRSIRLGLGGRWQNDISKVDEYTGGLVRQESYALLNAFARWDVTDNLYVRANVDNLTDEKYILSLYQIGYYGAPRHYSLSVGYRF